MMFHIYKKSVGYFDAHSQLPNDFLMLTLEQNCLIQITEAISRMYHTYSCHNCPRSIYTNVFLNNGSIRNLT